MGPAGADGADGAPGPQGPKGDPGDPATNLVQSVFGRIGPVAAQPGDYNAAQITGAVADTRQIIAGTGLTGGGPLNADVTLVANIGAIQTPWLQPVNGGGFALNNAGLIESKSGGFKFPDGSVQVTAATGTGGTSAVSMTVAAFDAETANGTTNPQNRSVVLLRDGLYTCLWNGAAWEYYHNNHKVRPGSLTTWTLLNATSGGPTGSFSVGTKAVCLTAPAANGENWRLLTTGNLPGAGSYTLTVALRANLPNSNVTSAGVWIGDAGSLPKFQFWGFTMQNPGACAVAAYRMTNPTTYSGASAFGSIPVFWISPLIFLRISVSSGTHTFLYSADGQNWIVAATGISSTAYLSSPAQWGVCANAGTALAAVQAVFVHIEAA